MNKIKSWLEKWQHRLQGHLLVSYVSKDDPEVSGSFWAKDIYTAGTLLLADMYGINVPAPISPEYFDITITGA